MAGEQAASARFGSAADGRGLALLRLDRVADALAAGTPIVAGGVAAAARQARLGALRLAAATRRRRS